MNDFEELLSQSESGDEGATAELLEQLYDELRRTAVRLLAHEKPGQTLQPTALVHEAYLRLTGGREPVSWENERHFASAAGIAMRRILVENARRKQRIKHGGERQRVPYEESLIATGVPGEDLLAVNEALEALSEHDARKAKLVELRYFAGLTLEEAAAALGISRATASRHWTYARAWLFDQVHGGTDEEAEHRSWSPG